MDEGRGNIIREVMKMCKRLSGKRKGERRQSERRQVQQGGEREGDGGAERRVERTEGMFLTPPFPCFSNPKDLCTEQFPFGIPFAFGT